METAKHSQQRAEFHPHPPTPWDSCRYDWLGLPRLPLLFRAHSLVNLVKPIEPVGAADPSAENSLELPKSNNQRRSAWLH